MKLITENLRIRIGDLPRFLKDYGDMFLSLAYFRDTLEALEPQFESFFAAMGDIRENYQLRQNGSLMGWSEILRQLKIIPLEGHFVAFDRQTSAMWDNMTPESFHRLKTMIESSHTTVGGNLCGCSVKLGAWDDRFGERDAGLISQAEFIMSEIRQDMDILLNISIPPGEFLEEAEDEAGVDLL